VNNEPNQTDEQAAEDRWIIEEGQNRDDYFNA
jgi:hypothetical protein